MYVSGDDLHDFDILRPLAEQYAAIAALPCQGERRKLWRDHFSLKPTRIPILATFGMWNVWCRDLFGEHAISCRDPFYRNYERTFRLLIAHHEYGSDFIVDPWLTMRAHVKVNENGLWGLPENMAPSGALGGAAAFAPSLTNWDDIAKLRAPRHAVDEDATTRDFEKLHRAIGDIIEIDIQRYPICLGFHGDISTSITKLRGMEQLMLDMYESPAELHSLLAFMRDSILQNHQEAENAGHFNLNSGGNQAFPYADTLPQPAPNSAPCRRKDIWGFCAAQEYTLVSPAFHDEFLFQYQKPIFEQFGLVHYGCCEDLSEKITMLRQLSTLRSIAVTPVANVRRCAEQIAADYVISWRPNPTDMVCCGYDESRIRRIITEGLAACRGGFPHIHLKDIETVEGDYTRLKRWTALVREIADSVWP